MVFKIIIAIENALNLSIIVCLKHFNTCPLGWISVANWFFCSVKSVNVGYKLFQLWLQHFLCFILVATGFSYVIRRHRSTIVPLPVIDKTAIWNFLDWICHFFKCFAGLQFVLETFLLLCCLPPDRADVLL